MYVEDLIFAGFPFPVFFIRRPMKAYLQTRDQVSALALVVLALISLVGFSKIVILAGFASLWPLLPAWT